MKKLIYLSVAVLVSLATACGEGANGDGGNKVAETFSKQITNTTNSADVSGSFRVQLGNAQFTVYQSETDSADLMVEVPVCAQNTEPVTKISKVMLTMWYKATPESENEKLFGDIKLPEDQFAKVLEMDKAANPADTVKYQFSCRLPKTAIDALRSAATVSTSSCTDNE